MSCYEIQTEKKILVILIENKFNVLQNVIKILLEYNSNAKYVLMR